MLTSKLYIQLISMQQGKSKFITITNNSHVNIYEFRILGALKPFAISSVRSKLRIKNIAKL